MIVQSVKTIHRSIKGFSMVLMEIFYNFIDLIVHSSEWGAINAIHNENALKQFNKIHWNNPQSEHCVCCKCDCSFQMQFAQIAFRCHSSLLLSYRSSLNVISYTFCCTFRFRSPNTPLYTIALKLLEINDYTQMELRNERTFFLSFGMRLMALTLFLSVFHFFSLTNNLLFCCRVTMCTLHTLQLQLSKTNRRICHGRCNAMIKIHKRFEKWKRNFTSFGMATEKSSKRHTTIRRWE